MQKQGIRALNQSFDAINIFSDAIKMQKELFVLLAVSALVEIAVVYTGIALNRNICGLSVIQMVISVFSLLVSLVFDMGRIWYTLEYYEGRKHTIKEVFLEIPPKLLKYFFTSILYGFLIITGAVLFIIPGFYWLGKYYNANTAVMAEDKNTNVFEISGFMTRKRIITVLAVLLISFILPLLPRFLVGLIPSVDMRSLAVMVIIGIIACVFVPFVICARVILYNKLKQESIDHKGEKEFMAAANEKQGCFSTMAGGIIAAVLFIGLMLAVTYYTLKVSNLMEIKWKTAAKQTAAEVKK